MMSARPGSTGQHAAVLRIARHGVAGRGGDATACCLKSLLIVQLLILPIALVLDPEPA